MRGRADRLFGKDYQWSILAAAAIRSHWPDRPPHNGRDVRLVGLEEQQIYLGPGTPRKALPSRSADPRHPRRALPSTIATPPEARPRRC